MTNRGNDIIRDNEIGKLKRRDFLLNIGCMLGSKRAKID